MRWAAYIYAPVLLAAAALTATAVPPSENAGRTGQYRVMTDHEQYSYEVCVPSSYHEGSGAGIHLFFHGEGGANSAGNFGAWKRHFLEPFNLIGINMAYADGKNLNDTAGKVAAAKHSVAQVMADYHVIPGRGAVGSHSGGGVPHSLWFSTSGGGGDGWPFNHQALYGSNFWKPIRGGGRNSYLIALGTGEWGMGQPILGISQIDRARDLFQTMGRTTCPDVYLKITKGKGHSISNEDVRDAAAGFRRWDLAFNAFVYEPAFAHAKVKPIARQANRGDLGPAIKALDLLESPKPGEAAPPLDDEARKQMARLRELIDERAADVLAMAEKLAAEDPVLYDFYGSKLVGQLRGHALEDKCSQIDAAFRKSGARGKAQSGHRAFLSVWDKLMTTKGVSIATGDADGLRQIRDRVGAESIYGKMVDEFLAAGDQKP